MREGVNEMDKKFINLKRIVVPFLTLVLLVLQATTAYCSPLDTWGTYNPAGINTVVMEVISRNDYYGSASVQYVEEFFDVRKGDWFYNDVMEARRIGLVAGVGNNMFAPNKTISYAEYITILTRVLGADTSNKGNSNHWAAGNIEAAKKLGIISEGEVTNYDAGIPREVMAVFTCKALGVKPGDGSQIIFEDTRNASPAIRAYINAAYNEYLTEGVGRDDSGKLQFGYGQTVTRAQLATMALRIKDYKENPQMFKHERDSDRKMQEQKWKEEQEKNKGGNKGGGQVTEYITWNGYKIPKGSVFYEMNKDGVLESGLDFYGAVRFITYPEQYDELYNILASKLDANTVKQAINYAKTNKKTVDDDIYKIFETPQGYIIKVDSVYGDFTVAFRVGAPKK